ncbi:hypothetical protein [Candidatus Hecatella orcuttiae]|jgi:PHD/YefM family antitoxin component YafN of YafNO toxin-antitoxin module|uniref:hypothetical protein n=1 Tax=Candidatus Hecatella orcuttiae TaxID=1935119 RepID=UPI002867B903|nr:hypothetical protein [Candidatus Hecatella orcuttiae]
MLIEMDSVVLNREQTELLVRTKNLLEELIETLDILANREMVKAIRRGEADLKAGRTRSYEEFVEELRKSDEI